MSKREDESRFDWMARWTGYWVIVLAGNLAAVIALWLLAKAADYFGL